MGSAVIGSLLAVACIIILALSQALEPVKLRELGFPRLNYTFTVLLSGGLIALAGVLSRSLTTTLSAALMCIIVLPLALYYGEFG